MSLNIATPPKVKQSKRKFLLAGIAATAFALFWNKFSPKPEQIEKIKLLTPEGKLVEVEKGKIKPSSTGRVSNQEIQDWMKTSDQKQ